MFRIDTCGSNMAGRGSRAIPQVKYTRQGEEPGLLEYKSPQQSITALFQLSSSSLPTDTHDNKPPGPDEQNQSHVIH